MGVVVRRYIDILIIIITFPYSTCISSFLAAASLLLCSFFKCFFVLVCYVCAIIIANVAQNTFKIVQKIEITQTRPIIISTSLSMSTTSPETSTCKVPIMASKR